MPKNNDIGIHGLKVERSINQGLPLLSGTGRGRNIKGVSTHPLGGNLKGKAGPRGGLKEKIDDGFSSKSGDLLYGTGGNFFKGCCGIKNIRNICSRELLNTKNVFMLKSICIFHVSPEFTNPSFSGLLEKLAFQGIPHSISDNLVKNNITDG